MIASSAFFVLDGILGWPVSDYDGSWSQWGQMSASSGNGGKLTSNTWATDMSTRSENIIYTFPTYSVELLTVDGTACSGSLLPDGNSTYTPSGCETSYPPDSTSASGNQIEEEDAAYM